MIQPHTTVLNHPIVRAGPKQAWEDSYPGVTGGHEEGGFILQNSVGTVSVVRWPKGTQNSIILSPHPNCKIDENDIVATFHTHPHSGSNYLQKPSETDKRAVRDDLDLKGDFYEGEFVISREKIYIITPNGEVSEVGNRWEILGE
ncbi:MAG: DUF4329 domain-containing protein [bacterium]